MRARLSGASEHGRLGEVHVNGPDIQNRRFQSFPSLAVRVSQCKYIYITLFLLINNVFFRQFKKEQFVKCALNSPATAKVTTNFRFAYVAAELMALRVTVLCLDCDLVCGRVTTGGGAQLKRLLKHKQGRGKKNKLARDSF